MNIETIRERILTDDEFVLQEVKGIQYACGLKNVIRYELRRPHDDWTESVAEHTYTMHVISDYFLPLELKAEGLDVLKIKKMITWHDMDEIETGDKISWKKTETDLQNELTAWQLTAKNLSPVVRDEISSVIAEYESQQSPEALFVKAIDKLDPLFHLYSEGGKRWLRAINEPFEKLEQNKMKHIEPYPTMRRFMDVIHQRMRGENFYAE